MSKVFPSLSCTITQSHRKGQYGEDKKLADREEDTVVTSLIGQSNAFSVLLGTAFIHIQDAAGTLHIVRALINSASQTPAITSKCIE